MKRILVAVLLAAAAFAASAQNTVRTGTLYTSAARTATSNGQDMANDAYRGVMVVLDITVAPGVDTVTLTIQGKDPVSGKYYTLLAGAAESATGTKVYRVYPSLPATANVSANDLVPQTWRVTVTHSAGTSFTYSVGYNSIY